MENNELPIEAGVFEFRGANRPLWIWVKTCETPDCTCRDVLVVANWHGRDELLASARPIAGAMENGASFKQIIESAREGQVVFGLDLDSGEELNFGDPSGLFADGAPRAVTEVIERLDGETLDDIGRLWARGKGQPNLEMTERTPSQIHGWQPGEMLGWNEAFYGTRTDIYTLDDEAFVADDHYCVKPGCTCGERVVVFSQAGEERGHLVGAVRVPAAGDAKLEPEPSCGRKLRGLWAAFQKRYPGYRERLDRHMALMQAWGRKHVPSIAAQLVEPPRSRAPGPNEPCPCGSGKKYKKCCWKTAIAGSS